MLYTNKFIINLKLRKYNFFKALIKGNAKYTKSLNFLLIFIISFHFQEFYFDTAQTKRTCLIFTRVQHYVVI